MTSPGGAPAPTELPFPDPPLSDGVVARRPWTDTDLDFIVAACQDPEIARFSPVIPVPYTEADALQWLELMDSIRLADSGLDLAITGVADGEMLGAIGIGRLDRMLATADIGYSRDGGHRLLAGARGPRPGPHEPRGPVARALGIRGARPGPHRAHDHPENIGSQRVAERCGFPREGRLRSHMLIRHSGQRSDSLVYGLLPGELRGG